MDEKKKILIVEDEVDFAETMKTRLESAGYEVSVAADAYLGTSETVKGEPDLVLLDLMMPAGGGFALLKRIRNMPSKLSIPVVILTSSDLDEDAEMATQLGADAFVLKTTRHEILLDVIERLLEKESKS